MDDLINEFISETIESLSELDTDLVELEKNSDDTELLSKIFRLMHTIKGTCGFLSLSRLEKTAHAGENLLDLFRSGEMILSETNMSLLFSCIDRVRYLIDEVHENGAEPDGEDQDIITKIEDEIAQNSIKPKSENSENEISIDNESIIDMDMMEMAKEELEKNNDIQSNAETKKEKIIETKNKPKESDTSNTIATSSKNISQKKTTEKPSEFLRVQMSVLENLINMVSELVLTRNQILQTMSTDKTNDSSTPLQRLNKIVSDLQEGVMQTRMQPIGNAWSKLPRIVRDLSMDLNKKITLEMSGEETELDRQVLELIKDPLTHMIRNSCDHGIETPENRIANGKPEIGKIDLKAYHEGGFIIVEIIDDGKGLDPDIIAEKALEKGLINEERLNNMSKKQIYHLLFKAGFSTAQAVTNVSGRGVGMDVVRTNIEKIGGTIDMDSELGKGTSFKIQIPLTLAIISALIVEIENERYAIPQLNIQELVRVHPYDNEKIETINDRPVFRLRDHILPLIDSKALFNHYIPNDSIAQDKKEAEEKQIKDATINLDNKLIAVISAGSNNFGLVVDQIHDMEEIVIKSISSVLQDTKIFAGNTILGDGNVIMILDPASIARQFDIGNDIQAAQNEKNNLSHQSSYLDEKAAMLMFKAGTGAPMAIPLALISRLQQIDIDQVTESGSEIIAKHNGVLLPLYFAADEGQTLDRDVVTTLILSDDISDAAIGIIIENVIDIVEDTLDLSTSTARSGVIGSVTLNNTIVDVVDIAYYLGKTKEDFFSVELHQKQPFIQAHETNEEYNTNQKHILVVDDSPFFRNMLKPILSAAGYIVTVSEDPIEAFKLHDQGKIYDVILSDIEMPNMDGYQFIEKIRDGSSWKNIPCIALTSHTTNEDIEYGYKKGFTKYIGKFDKDELTRTVSTVITENEAAK